MTFTLLPAVDVADGQVVRVTQGGADTSASFGAPRDAALAWVNAGAEWIHLVDLDAAFGRGSNRALLADLTRELDVNVELSAGISDDDALAWALSTECSRIILGTSALADRQCRSWCEQAIASHGERIAIGLDVRIIEYPDGSRDHRLVARGGTRDVGNLWDTIDQLDRQGCVRYVVTDVSRDGMLRGPNIDLYRAVTQATSTAVIASGGISALADLVSLAELAATTANFEGSIIGKALYVGRFTLPEAFEATRNR